MKTHNKIIYTAVTFLIILEIIFLINIFTKDYRSYKTITGIVTNNNTLTVMVDNTSLNNITKSKRLIINNKKITKYTIDSITRNIMIKNAKRYHQVNIILKLSKKYNYNDDIVITIYSKKKKIYEIFKSCWR